MILAEIVTDYSAPEHIKDWLQCLFWFSAFVAAVLFVWRQARGPLPHPPNESLAITSDELARRVAHLESENTKVWVKMETDARKLEKDIAEVNKNVSGLSATLEAANSNINLMKLSLDSFIRRR